MGSGQVKWTLISRKETRNNSSLGHLRFLGLLEGIMPVTEEHLLTLIIQSIELREIRLPLIHFFETSFGRTTERRIVLARLTDADGVEGWGECTAGEGPFYSDEWTETAWATLSEFLAPMVLGKKIESAAHVFALMKPVRGHRMAKATIETACWDLEAKSAGVPLWKHLGGTRTGDFVRRFDRHSGHARDPAGKDSQGS